MKIFLFLMFLVSACSAPPNLTLQNVLDVYKGTQDLVMYTASTDPNKLLGRPGQYIEKANFNDPRIEKQPIDDVPFNTIEVFATSADAQRRKTYTDNVSKAASPIGTYNFIYRNVVVRLDLDMLPADADAYRVALESIR